MECKYCGKILCKENKSGFCRKCGNKDPDRRKKNSEGLKRAHNEGKVSGFSIKASNAGRTSYKKNKYEEFLKNPGRPYSSASLRHNLIFSGRTEECAICKLTDWRGSSLILEIDHIDGNSFNNSLNNLRFICPNCHSQTKTFKGKNINKGEKIVTDEDLLFALKTSSSIRAALLKVGLTPRGGNYIRCYELLKA